MKAIFTHMIARALIVVAASFLSACGNKGPLVLPKTVATVAVVAHTV